MSQKQKVACQCGWVAFTVYGLALFCAGFLAGSRSKSYEIGIGFVILVYSLLLAVVVWSVKVTNEAHRAEALCQDDSEMYTP